MARLCVAERSLAVCICTYRRPHLLALLLGDLGQQNVQPEVLIVVDGDPESGDVRPILERLKTAWQIVYVPSNHANLPYQRYLGCRMAAGCRWLLYLDDDLRIPRNDSVEKVLAPLSWTERKVVGVTVNFKRPADTVTPNAVHGRDTSGNSWLVRKFGATSRTPRGGLSPSGNRRLPASGDSYAEVEWLRGGVMAYRLDALTKECFSDDLFALDHIGCDLGEDTFLSRRVGTRGSLWLAFCAEFDHPDADISRCYPIQARKFGYAQAYSRRFLNDHFRPFAAPKISDRIALLTSYGGNVTLSWWRALTDWRSYCWSYAWGYTLGTLRGLFQAPRARNLTPGIDWWADAEGAVSVARKLRGATVI